LHVQSGGVVANSATTLGWYVYFHEPAVKVTNWDTVSYVPYTFLEPGATSANTKTYAEFVPKQMNFLSTPEEPCDEDPNYSYEQARVTILRSESSQT
jgi:hypothetical protein